MRSLLFLLALAGCTKSSPAPATPEPQPQPQPQPEVAQPEPEPQPEPEATGSSTCADVATNLDRLLRAELGSMLPEDKLAELRGVVEGRCTDDAWTADARTCLAEVATSKELEARCEKKLTEAQTDAIDADFDRIFNDKAQP